MLWSYSSLGMGNGIVATPYELHSVSALHAGKDSAVEISKEFVLVAQSGNFQFGCGLHLPGILTDGTDNFVGFILCSLSFRGGDVFLAVCDACGVGHLTQRLTIQTDQQVFVGISLNTIALVLEGERSFSIECFSVF